MASRRGTVSGTAARIEDPILARIVDRLVATYRPERIYLFGSRARTGASDDSDYDLMVIVAGTHRGQ